MNGTQTLDFVSTVGKAGLSCETASGAWWIWLHKDGRIEREMNCRIVEKFDAIKHRRAMEMEARFHSISDMIAKYLNPSDTAEGSRMYWELRKTVAR